MARAFPSAVIENLRPLIDGGRYPVKRIVEETRLAPAAHLTCVAATCEEVDDVVRQYWKAGVRHIVALRGDMPDLSSPYAAHPRGYGSTPDLVAAIGRIAPFEISVGTYPERHPDWRALDDDIDLLKLPRPGTPVLGEVSRDHLWIIVRIEAQKT